MASSKRNTISLILVLALVGWVRAAEPNSTRKAPAPLSNTRYASCVVNITADPEIVPIASQTAMNLLIMSSAVGAKAARDELGVDEAAVSKVFQAIAVEPLTDSIRPGGSQPGYGRRGPFDRGPNGEMVLLDANYAGARPGSRPASGPRERGASESGAFRIAVTLPNDVRPAAAEFLRAIVENLRKSLDDAYSQYLRQISIQIRDVQEQRGHVQRELEDAMGLRTDSPVGRRLDTPVDMSKLTPETPFGEAVDMLRKSVPPLNITVLWRDLEEEAQVTPDTPIRMDGLPSVSLKTVLELLLKSVSPSNGTPITYRWEGQVITIGTARALGGPQSPVEQPAAASYILKSRRYDLDNQIRQVEMNLATANAKGQAIEEQIARLREMADKRLKDDTVTQELQTIIQGNEEALENTQKLAASGRVSEAEVAKARESLARARIDLAKRREELAKSVGGGQIEAYSDTISNMAVDNAENKAKLEMLRQWLSETERQLSQTSAADSRAQQVSSIQESINILDQRISDLRARQVNAQPPTVTVVGAN